MSKDIITLAQERRKELHTILSNFLEFKEYVALGQVIKTISSLNDVGVKSDQEEEEKTKKETTRKVNKGKHHSNTWWTKIPPNVRKRVAKTANKARLDKIRREEGGLLCERAYQATINVIADHAKNHGEFPIPSTEITRRVNLMLHKKMNNINSYISNKMKQKDCPFTFLPHKGFFPNKPIHS